jgi:hypothetical protein
MYLKLFLQIKLKRYQIVLFLKIYDMVFRHVIVKKYCLIIKGQD